MHIDGVQEISNVDGFKSNLKEKLNTFFRSKNLYKV